MSAYRPSRTHVIVAGAVLLAAAHGIGLRFLAARAALPAAIVFGVIALVLITHRQLLSRLHSLLRRQPGDRHESE